MIVMLEEMNSLDRISLQVTRLIDISISQKMLKKKIQISELISNLILLILKHICMVIMSVFLLVGLLLKSLLIQTTRLSPHYGSKRNFISFSFFIK